MASWIDADTPVFFDTDCLGCFLWTSNLLVLHRLFAGRICIPEEVVYEIMRRRSASPTIGLAQSDLKQFIATGKARQVGIAVGSNGAEEFSRLVNGDFMGRRLGKGESAALAHARTECGVIASNNLSDIVSYCETYSLQWITTTTILLYAVSTERLPFEQASALWERLIRAGTRMPYEDFASAWSNEARCVTEAAAAIDT